MVPAGRHRSHRAASLSLVRWRTWLLAVAGLGPSACVDRAIHWGRSPSQDTDDEEPDEPDPPVDPGSGCVDDEDCGDDQVCFEGTCVGSGELRFSLSWEVRTDLDLHVLTPSGEEVDYQTPIAGGGELDVDDCAGPCQDPGGTHVENIVFRDAPSGHYEAWVHNFDGERDASFRVEIAGAVNEEHTGSVGRPPNDRSATFVVDLP